MRSLGESITHAIRTRDTRLARRIRDFLMFEMLMDYEGIRELFVERGAGRRKFERLAPRHEPFQHEKEIIG